MAEHMMSEHTPPEKPTGEYGAGEPFDDQFGVPEFVQQIRDELNTVREAVSKCHEEMYGPMRGRDYMQPDPIKTLAYQQSLDALYKEESRLMGELRDLVWIIPPTFEPPHNRTYPTQEKAKEILRHGEVGGRALTSRQKGFFGVIAGGRRPTRVKKG